MAEGMLKSAYEVARDIRLQRNREMMKSLGLLETEKGNSEEDTKEHGDEIETKKIRPKRDPQQPTRRSKRVQGLSPEGDKIEDSSEGEEENHSDDAFSRVMQAKIERLKALHEERSTAYKNPTATYEHTWLRVRTMSEKALMRRIKVIENALGQHCVVKMRMFAEVLLLANKDDLAKEASEALDRLLSLGLQ